MKKTVFVGRVNDQEFDNVKDYNACVQAMLDMGEDFQATSSTQVVDVPEDDCECTCSGKDECSKCNHDKKPLKPVTAMLPAYENKENGKYIDSLICMDDDEYDKNMDNLDIHLNEVYEQVKEAIPHNSPEQLEVYANAVNDMLNTLYEDSERTEKALEPVNNRICELEAELEDLYDKSNKLTKAADVIGTYREFYSAVDSLLEGDDKDDVTNEQVQEAAQKLTSGFASLLKEIFG